MTKAQRPGTEFERLVARMERILRPTGAVVASPDYLIDTVTGSRREVDASIRVKVGDKEEITTVECRDYASTPQDDRWLEQLVTKRERLGVKQTIAVSSTGFTSAATTTAKHYGIELRKMDQITDAEIAQKWAGFTITIHFPKFTLTSLRVDVDIDQPPITNTDLPSGDDQDLTLIPLIRFGNSDEVYSAADIFNGTIERCPWPEKDEEFSWSICMGKTEMPLYLITKTGERSIDCCLLTYSVLKAVAASPIQSANRYKDADTRLLDHVTSVADLGDFKVKADTFGQFGSNEKKAGLATPGPDESPSQLSTKPDS